MKKTLAVAAVLAAFAGTAMADVTLYGRIDTGLVYMHTDNDAGVEADKASMEAGFTTGSRWGIKGQEKLGEDLTVGFVLESGFSGDDGKSGQGSRLFGREALLYVAGDFGTFYAGRFGTIVSDSGSLSLMGNASAFGNCYGLAAMKASTGAKLDRYDNSIAYKTPKMGGLTVQAMYSLERDSGDKLEGTHKAERYAAVGAHYAAGPLTVVALADYTMHAAATGFDDNGYNIVVGGNYAFDGFKLFGKVAYFDNQQAAHVYNGFKAGSAVDKTTQEPTGGYVGLVEGYGVEVGTHVPVAGGTVKAAIQYRDAEDSAKDYTLMAANVAYDYPLSKRTHIWSVVGYGQEKAEKADKTPSAYQAGVGLVHKF